MRILAIRGRNLASLYGDFELPLDRGPIADAGLFSISGPTGSGKSTLMDALCLALYGETPRFDERGKGVKPGRAGEDADALIDANDKRNLLSRGTGEGFAEVDFEAMDGKRYTARWTVRRARGRPDGRFQAVTMALEDAAGQAVCAGIDEVRKRVQELVGYSFQEFRRSVVLPQFEFRAFLDADENTRAQILERVTGTEIYAAISRKAHERAAAERAALGVLQDRAAGLVVLEPVERAAAEADAKALEGERERARGEKAAAEGDVRWHEVATVLARELAEAASAVEQAEAAVSAVGERRRELADVERVQPLRPVRDDARRTAVEHCGAVDRREAAVRTMEDARRAGAEAQRAHGAAEKGLRSCLDATEALRPALDRARSLDAQVAAIEPRVARAEDALAKARQEAAESERDLQHAGQDHAEAERARAAAAAWLEQHCGERLLASDWPRWRQRLADHASLGAELRRAADALRVACEQASGAAEQQAKLAAEVERERRAAEEVEARLAAALQACAGDDLAALAARVSDATALRDVLAGLRAVAGEASDAARDRDTAAADAASAAASVDQLVEQRRACELKLASAEARLETEREALARLTAELSVAEHRAELVEGEPCPLCGATEHPYAKSAPAESARKAQQDAVTAAEQRLKALRDDSTRTSGQLAAAQERARSCGEVERRCAASLAGAERRFAAAVATAALQDVPATALAAVPVLDERIAAAAAALTAAQRAQADAVSRRSASEQVRTDAERIRRSLDGIAQRLRDAERHRERAASDAALLDEKVRGLTLRRDGAEADLEPALAFRPGWRDAAREEPEALVRACEAIAAAHAGQERAHATAVEALAALGPRVEAARTAVREKATRAAEAERLAVTEREALAELARERGQVLGGRPVAEVEQERGAAEQRARGALDAAAERLRAADVALGSARTSLEHATTAVLSAAGLVARAASALDAALATAGISAEQLDALLERDAAWIAGERGALAALDAAVRDERARRAERQRRADDHEQGRPPCSVDEARARAAAAAMSEDAALQRLTDVLGRLRDDDRNRETRGSLAQELARQRAVSDRWEAMSSLVGSADGKKLRIFAQGLALDALLAAANRHLQNLAPRYSLQRVPRRDLDLQVVDGDLGDDVRGVNGLSGGESFLVSLALALGLSSLSTRRTQAKTLFIDEGFGTLDRDTLEQAMAAIDQLGAGDRTVGVISHVPELHERIGVKVTVERVSAGRSRLVLPDGTPARAAAESTRRAS